VRVPHQSMGIMSEYAERLNKKTVKNHFVP
jgi:hypothetical protein